MTTCNTSKSNSQVGRDETPVSKANLTIELLGVERYERRAVLDEGMRFSGVARFVESNEVAFEDARDQHGSEPLALSIPLVGERGALERALAEDEERRANLWAGCETHVLDRDRERKSA